MVAQVTLADIDVVRVSLATVTDLYRQSVVPALQRQPGYRGAYGLATPEGKAMVVTFWETEQDAQAHVASGVYDEQVEKFVTFYRAAPGRETYEVMIADIPALLTR
ncbi:MAG TPA: antibiotic biosynthesis monooxygenase [Solirubrobacteraceae bacterium]|nr:antibiotic biosynthesis monooxygenase [Solirubrobacteraceae bacterium]